MNKIYTIMIALMLVASIPFAAAVVSEPQTFEWDGHGADSLKCSVPDVDDPRYVLYNETGGWMHWVFNTKGTSTNASLMLDSNGNGTYEPGEPMNAAVWHFYTPYFDITDDSGDRILNANVELEGGFAGAPGKLILSDYCPGTNGGSEVQEIPEFPAIALPIAAILGLAFFFQRRKE